MLSFIIELCIYSYTSIFSLPLTITNQVYNAYDVPVLLVEILLCKPWHKDGKVYSAGRWVELQDEALGQAEAQVNIVIILHPCKSNDVNTFYF